MSSEGFRFNFDEGDDGGNVAWLPPPLRRRSPSADTGAVPAVLVSRFPTYALRAQLVKEWAECYPKDPRRRMELVSSAAGKHFPPLLYQRAPDVSGLTSDGGNLERRDIIPGKYYGGLKVWSCAPYLVEYMFENRDTFGRLFEVPEKCLDTSAKNTSPESFAENAVVAPLVAEVGCGQGLPGIAALLLGARRVIFQDYNEEVLQTCVKPNIAVNWLRHAEDAPLCGLQPPAPPLVQMVSGDWSHLRWEAAGDGGTAMAHDACCRVVLGSDVTFDEAACEKLAAMLDRGLSPAGGVAYIASKQYYFGTNGGALEFQKRAADHGLEVAEVSRMDEAGGMQRLIMRVRRRCG
ncbi:hypothetical protein TraAM80_02972 [Trypanosoma rangeli]|uniref:protein-histidine N-methyltransferase n=1 Tax=Trypanosoma rangeli TaxID=5698 RepID=A0A422NRE8_TRYRA|nr:uncharacterized protein TraAM80_02972 [Trypanosoma rangeli]RNF08038.1 hypothetical protein TraAM80_02972 [Trypanosoma rangeli]|eukprot:RNF08038.1 hypothetical protein TraAM80_02972 [Trypanosoma rangeli]